MGLSIWFLAGGLPAFNTLRTVLAPTGYLARLGATTARLPAGAVASLGTWRRVIYGA